MKISQAFPSKYLKSDEVGAGRYTLTIASVTMEDVGDGDSKPVVYFSNADKGMVLNKTNAEMISYLYGDDTDAWLGKAVELYTTMVSYQGRSVLGLRVCAPAGMQTQRQVLNGPLPASPAMPAHTPPAAPAPGQREVQPAPPLGAPPSDFATQSAHAPAQGGGDLDDEIPFAPCIH